MSAFVVSTDTIDYLVTAARLWRLAADAYLPDATRDLTDSELGKILLDENVRSVNHRYRRPQTAPAHVYRSCPSSPSTPPRSSSPWQCVDYQSCETNDWQTTLAYRVLKAIESGAIAHLPGYSAAPWGWTRPPVPQCSSALSGMRCELLEGHGRYHKHGTAGWESGAQ